MKQLKWIGCAWLVLLTVAGCASVPPAPPAEIMTPEERTAMQSCLIDGTVDTVMAATIEVLQDKGWSILKADRGTGLLQAETERRLEALGPAEEGLNDYAARERRVRDRQVPEDQWTRWERVTVHIEPWNEMARLRLVLVRCGSQSPMSYDKRVDGSFFSRGRVATVNVPPREESCEVLYAEVYEDWMDRVARAAQLRGK